MRILFIRYKKSNKILEGGEQVSKKNYDVLSSIVGQDNVDIYYIHDETRRRSKLIYLKAIFCFPSNYYFGLTPARVRKICELAKEYDCVWIDRSIFGIVARELKKRGYKGRIISFFHNVEEMYFDAKLKKTLPFRGVVTHCAASNDGFSCRYSDRIVGLNERDGDELTRRYGRYPDELIPVAFQDAYRRESYPTELTRRRPLCVFLGSYFPANTDGIEWFVKNVYPYVDIQMRIVGKGMEKLQGRDWLGKDIEVVPNAPELLPHFEEADMIILPIFKGGGMKVKTCESLMYGKHILGTDEAWEGYQIDKQQAGGLCNTAEEFINRIKEFQEAPRPRFNTYSREMFLANYTIEAVQNKFRKLLTD